MKYYSPSTGGMYDSEVHSAIPADVVMLTDEEYDQLKGQVVIPGPGGRPILGDPDLAAPMTLDQVLSHRLSAYRAESDQMKLEAEYDALSDGAAPDYTAWLAKVREIKERYPLPL